MVTLPPEFVAIKYPGYFWNIEDKHLYSIKVSGVLRRLKGPYLFWDRTRFGPTPTDKKCYKVSVGGVRKYVFMEYLENLEPQDSVIPTESR